jgi:2-polyprenyl-6-methoxyphenol hydroxylase-like FAD-dependent oxidoreductase
MNALIIGAGVCGPVAAMALQRAAIDAVVYEAHQPPAADVGSYLTIATNGLDALRAIDAAAPTMAAGFPTGRTVLFSGTGKRLGAVPIGSTGDDRMVSHTIKRAHLHRVLHLEARRPYRIRQAPSHRAGHRVGRSRGIR